MAACDQLAQFQNALRVSGRLLLGADVLFLALHRGGVLDFPDAISQQVDLLRQVADIGCQLLLPGCQLLPFGERGGIGRQLAAGLGVRVEDVELAQRLEQGLVVVRSVQVDQQGAQPFQEGERDRGVVHECLSASRRLDDPAQDELAVVARLQSVLRQHVVDGRRPVETEGRFHDALRLPARMAEESARSPSSRVRAPIRMDLPAPVSPVMMFSPGWN